MLGDNGVLTNARYASEQTKIAEYDERLELIVGDERIIAGAEMKGLKRDTVFDRIKLEKNQRTEEWIDKVEKKGETVIVVTSKEGYVFYIMIKNGEEYIEYKGSDGEFNEEVNIADLFPEIPETVWIPIYNKQDLMDMGTGVIKIIEGRSYTFNIDSNYILKNDIDLSGVSWDSVPYQYFEGMFFGNDKKLTNFKSTRFGLFFWNIGYVSNLVMEDVQINTTHPDGTGAIASVNTGTIENCYVSGSIIGIDYGVGGIAGYNSGTIKYSYNISSVSSNDVNRGNCQGGITGSNTGIIEECYNIGNISGYFSIGGIAGENTQDGEIRNCYNKGNVSGGEFIGGITGCSYGIIQTCYNEGTITGFCSGGIVGSEFGNTEDCYNTGTISHEYAGGIAGESHGNIENCYNIGDVSGTVGIGEIVGMRISK